MPDTIELRGLRALGRHGTTGEERDQPQPFQVNVTLAADLSRAATTDDLADTIDYGEVAMRVAGIVANSSFHLLEALAARIADELFALAAGRATSVTVEVQKVRPPVPVDLDVASVTVTQTRNRPR